MSRAVTSARFIRRIVKPGLHMLAALPIVWLTMQWGLALSGEMHALGVDAIETTIRMLGDWAIRILLAALAVTPLARSTGRPEIIAVRRMVGLWAFAYVCMHLIAYFGMDRLFSLTALWDDVAKRIYITLGMTSFALLVPLAATSTAAMVRRLGGRRWQRLHRLIYVIGPLAVLHHWFMVKGVQLAPIVHGLILAMLLGYRLLRRRRVATV